jgi:hypothetical protein
MDGFSIRNGHNLRKRVSFVVKFTAANMSSKVDTRVHGKKKLAKRPTAEYNQEKNMIGTPDLKTYSCSRKEISRLSAIELNLLQFPSVHITEIVGCSPNKQMNAISRKVNTVSTLCFSPEIFLKMLMRVMNIHVFE